jgi:hypothetical protein
MQEILHRWYNIDKDFLFDFPEHFMEVPAMESSSMYWTKPMSSKEVIERLRGEKANEAEGDHLIQPIMAYYKDVVSSTQKLLAEHKKKFNSNLHHWNVLLSSRASKKVPKFLMMDAPVLKPELFPDGDISNLKTEFRSILDKAAELMVEATIQEREKIDARLRREAVELLDVVRESAMKKWMDAQRSIDCTFNRWDLIFPVEMWNSTTSSRQAIPISSVIFRTAMKACQSNICRERETELQQKTDAQNALQREKDKRRQAQSKASSLPPREMEKSLDKRMEEKLAPMRDDLREIKRCFNQTYKPWNARIRPGTTIDPHGEPMRRSKPQRRKQSGPRGRPGNDLTRDNGNGRSEDHRQAPTRTTQQLDDGV